MSLKTKEKISIYLQFMRENALNDEAQELIKQTEPILLKMTQRVESGAYTLAEEVSEERIAVMSKAFKDLTESDITICVLSKRERDIAKEKVFISFSGIEQLFANSKAKVVFRTALDDKTWCKNRDNLAFSLGHEIHLSLAGKLESYYSNLWIILLHFSVSALAGDTDGFKSGKVLVEAIADGILPLDLAYENMNPLYVLKA